MSRHSRSIGSMFAWLTFLGVATAQIPTCPGYGLSVVGGKLGDPWSFSIFGPPNAPAILATDVASGPVGTPVGAVCLGLTPAIATLPVTLDSTGAFAQAGILPLAAPIAPGSTLYTQAVVADPSQPGGYNLTNGAFLCVDSFTGAPVLTIPGVAPPGSINTQEVVASDDGSLLFAFGPHDDQPASADRHDLDDVARVELTANVLSETSSRSRTTPASAG